MNYVVIDVREPDEFEDGHVRGAINIPPAKLMNQPEDLVNIPKDAALIIYCRSGSRSSVSKNILQKLGYTNITNGINQQQVEAKFDL